MRNGRRRVVEEGKGGAGLGRGEERRGGVNVSLSISLSVALALALSKSSRGRRAANSGRPAATVEIPLVFLAALGFYAAARRLDDAVDVSDQSRSRGRTQQVGIGSVHRIASHNIT